MMRKVTHGVVAVWAVVAALQQGPVYRVGRGVTQPEVVKEVRPSHTPAAMQRRIQGRVLLEAIVEADGRVGEVRVTESLDQESGLDQEAIEVLKQWEFKPGTHEGKPVAVGITVEMQFRLK